MGVSGLRAWKSAKPLPLTRLQMRSRNGRLLLLLGWGTVGVVDVDALSRVVMEEDVESAVSRLRSPWVWCEGGRDLPDRGSHLLLGALFDDDLDQGLLVMYRSNTRRPLVLTKADSGIAESEASIPPLNLSTHSLWLKVVDGSQSRRGPFEFDRRVRNLWTLQRSSYVRLPNPDPNPNTPDRRLALPDNVWNLKVLTGAHVKVLTRGLSSSRLDLWKGSSSTCVLVDCLTEEMGPCVVYMFDPRDYGARGWFFGDRVYRSGLSTHYCPRILRLSRASPSLFAIAFSGSLQRSSLFEQCLGFAEDFKPPSSISIREMVTRMKESMAESDVLRLPAHLEDRFALRWFPLSGYGVYSRALLRKGSFLGHYTGKLVDKPAGANDWYVWALFDQTHRNNPKRYIDGDYTRIREAGYLSLFNTSATAATANVVARLERDGEDRFVRAYYSTEDVPPGKQLLVYYGEEYVDYIRASQRETVARCRAGLDLVRSFLADVTERGLGFSAEDSVRVARALLFQPRIVEQGMPTADLPVAPPTCASMPPEVFTWMREKATAAPTAPIMDLARGYLGDGLRAALSNDSDMIGMATAVGEPLADSPRLSLDPSPSPSATTLESLLMPPTAPLLSDCVGSGLVSDPASASSGCSLGLPLSPSWIAQETVSSAAQRAQLNMRLTLDLHEAVVRRQIPQIIVLRPEAVFRLLEGSDSGSSTLYGEKRPAGIGLDLDPAENARLNVEVRAILQRLLSVIPLPASVSLPTTFQFYKMPNDDVVMFRLM